MKIGRRFSLGIVVLAAALSIGSALHASAVSPGAAYGTIKTALAHPTLGQGTLAQPEPRLGGEASGLARLGAVLAARATTAAVSQAVPERDFAAAWRGQIAGVANPGRLLAAQARGDASLVDIASLAAALGARSASATFSAPSGGYAAPLDAVLCCALPGQVQFASQSELGAPAYDAAALGDALPSRASAFAAAAGTTGYAAPLRAALDEAPTASGTLSSRRATEASLADPAALAAALRAAR